MPPEPNSPPFIFVSYAHADQAFVARLLTDLAELTVPCWVDHQGLPPGTPDWEQAIREAIHACRALLLVASPDSRRSRFVKAELDVAELHGRPILPLWAAGEAWIESIPLGLSTAQFVDARGERYGQGLAETVAALRALARRVTGLARRIDGSAYEDRRKLALKGHSRTARTWLVRNGGAVVPPPSGDPSGPEGAVGAGDRWLEQAPLAPPLGGYLGAVPERPLVAREAEVARITTALEAMLAGRGRCVLLAGEPGVGKTRLAQEVMLAAQGRAIRVLIGRCYEEDGSLPFSPFSEALANALDLASPALRVLVPRRFADLGLLLPALGTGAPPPENQDPRRRIIATAGRFLAALAGEGPVALLLDDLHWADSASLELFAHLVHALRGERVLLLGTYRDADVGRRHPLEAMLTDLTRDRVVETITLRALLPTGTAALIGARFGVDHISDELRDLIHLRAEGNPFFTEELLTALGEQGAVYQDGDAVRYTMPTEMELPQSLRSLVGQRVGRLAAEAQEMLRLACVLGQEFELEVLLEAAGQDEETVFAYLETALEARLLEERRMGRQERYAFTHSLIGRILYDEVPRFRLRRLHLRAGEALERARGRRPETAAELARHFLAAGDEERGLRYTLAAGDYAAGLYAHAEAARHFTLARDLSRQKGDDQGTAAVLRKLGATLVNQNRTEEAVAVYEEARAVYSRAGNLAAQAEVAREIGWAYQVVQDFASAAPHLETALRLWPAGQEDEGLARLLLDTARARSLSGDTAAAGPLAEQGWALAERLGAVALQAQGLVERAIVITGQGQPRQGLLLLNQAEILAKRGDAQYTLFRVCHNRGATHGRLGELRQCLADSLHAAALADELGLPGRAVLAMANVVEMHLVLGEWAQGREAAKASLLLDPADPLGVRPMLAWMAGDTASALDEARQTLLLARRRQDTERTVTILFILANWHLELGSTDEGLAIAREATAAATHVGRVAEGAARLAEAAVRATAPDAAAQVAEAAAAMEREQLYLVHPWVLRAEGLLRQSRGDTEGALAALQQSADLAREQGALPEWGRTLAALAHVARVAGASATADQADQARAAIIDQIGPEVRGLVWARVLPEYGDPAT